MSDVRTDERINGGEVAIAWVLALVTLGYFLPWAIAATRGKSNSGAIGLVNFLAGWTVIGWIVALVMACMAHQVVGLWTPPATPVATPATWVDPATGRTCAMNPATGQPMFIDPVTGLQLVEPVVERLPNQQV